MKTSFIPTIRILTAKRVAWALLLHNTESLKGKLFHNFLQIQIFVIVVVAGLLMKETLGSGFGFEISINTLFTFLWLVAVYLFKMPGRVSVIVSLLFILTIPFFMLFGAQRIADQDSILAYLILVLGILQIWRETIFAKENKED